MCRRQGATLLEHDTVMGLTLDNAALEAWRGGVLDFELLHAPTKPTETRPGAGRGLGAVDVNGACEPPRPHHRGPAQ